MALMRIQRVGVGMVACLVLGTSGFAQIPDLQQLMAAKAAAGVQGAIPDPVPTPVAQPTADQADIAAELKLAEKFEKEIQGLKKREKGPRRFGSDLFDYRQPFTGATEGGVAEDYVLGAGDQLQLSVFGSATFELPLKVDGRGEVLIPKVGSVKVSGLPLAKARQAIHAKVSQSFSRVSADLSVTRLRDVRVFILGEVYKPGAYLVPSLSSLVNVLSLAGGPNAYGSYRQIRVMRGGHPVFQADLYPLRAEGLGNLNFSLQNGDTVFVPLVGNTVTLEGSFKRLLFGTQTESVKEVVKVEQKLEGAVGQGKLNALDGPRDAKAEVAGLAAGVEEAKRILPVMQFELLANETALDAVRFAGGLLPEAYQESLSLRRQDAEGLTSVQDLPFGKLGEVRLNAGDILSANSRKEQVTSMVSVTGWVRVPGSFGRSEGLRIGSLLRRDRQVLPDTYLGRGEVVRTLPDGSTRYLSFDVTKALAGDPVHDLLLEDRDRLELIRLEEMRLPKKVTISGPLTRPGTYDLHGGMRVADLVFKGGILQKYANRFFAELARFKDGKVSEVVKLDLARLESTELGSPVRLADDSVNPLLRDDDQVTVYEKPQFRVHRTVRIQGQVARPGVYVVESEPFRLSDLIQRAGGLTPDAMPSAGVFFRRLGAEGADVTKEQANPSQGMAEILERLNETKFYLEPSVTGQAAPKLFRPPVLHGFDVNRDNRLVVDFDRALRKDSGFDVVLQDQDSIIIPRKTDSVMVLGEAATPFAFFKVTPGMSVSDLLTLAGGTTRNADTRNIRLMRADGRIVDSWVKWAKVQPGDALLIPQRIRRDTTWQENLQALTPIAILLNAIRN